MTKHIALVFILALVLGAGGPAFARRKVKPQVRAEMEKALKLLKSRTRTNLALVKQHLLKANQLESNVPEVLYNLGVVAELSGKQSEALSYYKKAISASSDYAPPVAKLGEIAYLKGNYSQANDYFQKAIKIDKVNALARNYLSKIARLKKQYPQSITHARFALMGNRENVEAYNNLAATYYAMGLYELAQLVCVSALKIHTRSPATYNLQGLLYLKTNDVKRATSKFREALRYDPGFFEAHVNLATATLNFSDFTTAHKHLLQALKKKPKHIPALLAMAVAKRGLKKYQESIAVYKKVISLQSGNMPARYNLCILYQEYMGGGVPKLQAALGYCLKYKSMTTSSDPKWQELEKRIKGLQSTIKVLSKINQPKPTKKKP